MRFKMSADMEFEADDIASALEALEDYFACASAGEKHSLEYSADYYRENAAKPTLEDCADKATKMVEIRRQRIESNSDK